MEKKLRRRFVVISTMATFFAFIILISFVDFAAKKFVVNMTGAVADIVIENDGEIPKDWRAPRESEHINEGGFMDPPTQYIPNEVRYTTRFFTAEISKDNEITNTNFDNISDYNYEVANEVLKLVVNSANLSDENEQIGYQGDYVYKIIPDGNGVKRIVFIDSEAQLQVANLATDALSAISFVILILVFILSCIFSKKAVQPIVDAQNKQKEFITNVSHELKTPLAIIKANTEVMEVIEGESEWTSSNHKQVERLNKLVSYLVSLTKFEEKKNDKLKLEFSLSDAVSETADNFKTIAEAEGKNFIINIDNNISYTGDEHSIRMMFSTLIENSVKYSKENTDILITLNKKSNKAVFTIKNIADNLEIGDYKRLFERFHREDKSRNSASNSFGIGLSIANTIVQNHKGNISAKSEDGESIIFTVVL